MMTKDGKKVTNCDIIEKIYAISANRQIEFVKVKAHQKDDGYLTEHNNAVDKIAKLGAKCENSSAIKT